MQSLLQDFRYGVRMLFKNPGLTGIAVFALALGIGLTTTMWSINYGAMLRGLPFENDHELVHLERARASRGIDDMGVPIHDYTEWRRAQTSFTELAGFYEGTVNISGSEGEPERFEGAFVTPNTFRMLRITPALGRGFSDEEGIPNAPPVVILGWQMWQQRYAGDSAIIGRTIRANGTTAQVVGVMPRGFEFPTNAKVWLPMRVDPASLAWGEGNYFEVMGRLKPGVTLDAARREMEVICARIAQEHPEQNEGVTPILQSFINEYIPDEPRLMLWTMFGAVIGVLLIACANVANLLLARAAIRTKEVAVRTALGASRWRIVSQLLTESLVLTSVGAVFGILLAWVGVRLFNNAITDAQPPYWIDIRLDLPILGFVAGITLLAAVVAGLVPALQTTRTNLYDVLKDESRGSSSLRLGKFSKSLVVVELALSCGLLVSAGFMIQSVVQFSNNEYGVPTEGVFTARIGLFDAAYPDSASRERFWRDVEQRLHALPGHAGSALMTNLPGLGANNPQISIEGETYAEDRNRPRTASVAVTPGYFQTFGLDAVEGRLLNAGDVLGALPVAVVSRNFATENFAGQSPVGRRIRFGGEQSQQPWLTIVGVVPDVWYRGNDGEGEPETVFTPIAQGTYQFLSLAIRANGNPMTFAEPVRQQVMAVDRDQPIYFVNSLQDAIAQNGWFYAVFGSMFAIFGVAALVLAVIGVYGVMSFAVTRRTQEVGIRMALGAGGSQVLGLFMRQGLFQVGIGVTSGILLALLLAQGIRAVLFQVNVMNPVMYLGVSLALAATGLLASFIPARRATRVDPMVALRYE